MKSRFSRWDSTQDPLGGEPDLRQVLDELTDDLLFGEDAGRVLQDLQRRGISGHARGLDELLRRVRAERRRVARELNLSGPLDDVARELAEILSLERAELARRESKDARLGEALLDALPDSISAAIGELTHYEFSSRDAGARFAALLDRLRREVLDARFRGLTHAMRELTPEDIGRVKDMLADLNALLSAHARRAPYDFRGFMARHGGFFPENPASVEEVVDALAARAAAASRFMAGLSPEQRAELQGLAAAAFDDVDLDWQLSELARSLHELRPDLDWDRAPAGSGEEAMPLGAALDAVERLSAYDQLERQLAADYPGASLDDVDEDALRRSLGEDAARDLRRLKEIEAALQQADVLARAGGRMRLTARGARLLGERSLVRAMARLRREPSHRAPGGLAEVTGQSRAWAFGDSEPLSVQRTVFNAVTRTGARRPLHLSAEDFEVEETESRARVATALLLDLSYSMPLGGHWVPAKRMALALAALIESKYPEDELLMIGFSDYAREMQPVDLACAGWEEVHGTNMQHAFLLARRRLGDSSAPVKQVMMVTDGEPTAHLEADGRASFHWPPTRRTIDETLREAMRLARSGISLNVFMVEHSRALLRFMEKLARLTGGDVLTVDSAELASYVVGGYQERAPKRSGR